MKRNRFNNKDALKANQEDRGGNVVKAFRKADQNDASLMAGSLYELSQSNDIPPVSVRTGYEAFVLDPRKLDKRIIRGMIAGLEIGKFTARICRSEEVDENHGYDVSLGDPELLLPKRRTLLVPLQSEKLKEEVLGVGKILHDQGIPGFSSDGRQPKHKLGMPKIAIGNFDQPVSKRDENQILEAVDLGLDVALMRSERSIGLGELVIKQYRSR